MWCKVFKSLCGGRKMNLVIRNIDPKTRGLLYRLQGEKNCKNLGDTLTYLINKYYDGE